MHIFTCIANLNKFEQLLENSQNSCYSHVSDTVKILLMSTWSYGPSNIQTLHFVASHKQTPPSADILSGPEGLC